MGFNLYSLTDIHFDTKFIGVIIAFGVFLPISLFLLYKAINDKRKYEEYSNIELIGSSGIVCFDIAAILLSIIAVYSHNSDHVFALYIATMSVGLVSIIFLTIYAGAVAKRKAIYEGSDKSKTLASILCLILEIIFETIWFAFL